MKNTTRIGLKAEQLAAEYLISNGYKVIERNFRNRYCEIDIIALQKEFVCLVEVKYRKNDLQGGGLEAINHDKKRRLRNAFEYWLFQNEQYQHLQPRIDVVAVDAQRRIELIKNAI